ncbi:rabenosyn-5 [Anaeramoeba flamelloides]|uniref:Rabenosyn-5 n=1 Tax=Anaeramoeba flamelloides TaxID=1746091 RepID=A0ABQ8YKY0_9EUKA|nr:rabenosyn-5 [Anaeramoeba flamelloides]
MYITGHHSGVIRFWKISENCKTHKMNLSIIWTSKNIKNGPISPLLLTKDQKKLYYANPNGMFYLSYQVNKKSNKKKLKNMENNKKNNNNKLNVKNKNKNNCSICNTAFRLKRKYYCQICNKLVCNKCSTYKQIITESNLKNLLICNNCLLNLDLNFK